ncbi:Soluble epoxide hydrolase [Ceraceosorus bombacis]|uniref:Soluble epoxide hydrolase n=1 Tax=Ceraceosorus bombacis TaxID=401625 RepID=A0A0P1BLC1_9BASI|nr:Soluble epoxide hydrolase [Ceraceosorus bombacis]
MPGYSQSLEDRFESRFYVTPRDTPPSRPSAEPTSRRYRYFYGIPPRAAPDRPHLLFCHGFPDAQSFLRILTPFVLAGFHCVAPDMLGYGLTSRPPIERIAEYGAGAQVKDLVGLMESLVGTNDKFVVIGHDWGAYISWFFGVHAPTKIAGIAGLSVPFTPTLLTSELPDFDELLKRVPSFGYQAFFADPKSTKIIEDKIETFTAIAFIQPRKLAGTRWGKSLNLMPKGRFEQFLTTPQDPALERTVKESSLIPPGSEEWERALRYFDPRRGGTIDGGLNYYRCRQVNWEEGKALRSQKLPKGPAYLLIMSTHDAALPASLGSKMSKHLEDPSALTTHIVKGAGHWIHLEQPALTVQLIRKWLETRVGWGRAGHL